MNELGYSKGSLELFSNQFSIESLTNFILKNNEGVHKDEHSELWFTFSGNDQYVHCSVMKEELISKRITLEIGSDKTGNEIPFKLAREVIRKFIDYFDDLAIISYIFIEFDIKNLILNRHFFDYTFNDVDKYYSNATLYFYYDIEDKVKLDEILNELNSKIGNSTYRIYPETNELTNIIKEYPSQLFDEQEIQVKGYLCEIGYPELFFEKDLNTIIDFIKINNINYIGISTQFIFKGNDRDIVLKGRSIF